LIEHEARQLAQLAIDRKAGIRSLFVTADGRLLRLAANLLTTDPSDQRLDQAISSHRGLIQLTDLLFGVQTDPVSLARLIWAGGLGDEAITIRNYYTGIALQHYSDAIAMTLPEVLDVFVPRVTEEAKRQDVQLFPFGTVESKSRTARFLDRFEDEFYADMAEVIRKKHPEEHPFVQRIRHQHLEEHIEETLQLIKEYESKERESDDALEKAECQRILAELHTYLDQYKSELNDLETSSS
jgi:hypothetical protein